ncbi:MAG TPA: ScyD/ScyE family protein [Vicinamibacterales bacterium]|nr:ScyD/ScyE family protein [Vicinamibacterales bacterium]
MREATAARQVLRSHLVACESQLASRVGLSRLSGSACLRPSIRHKNPKPLFPRAATRSRCSRSRRRWPKVRTALYVGQLTGFPFPVGGAAVFRVVQGSAPEVFVDGFTNVIDIAFDRQGALYVLEISHNGLLSGNPVGALIKVTPGGAREELFPGALISPGGMTIGRDGAIYVTRFATLPGVGDVVRIQP